MTEQKQVDITLKLSPQLLALGPVTLHLTVEEVAATPTPRFTSVPVDVYRQGIPVSPGEPRPVPEVPVEGSQKAPEPELSEGQRNLKAALAKPLPKIPRERTASLPDGNGIVSEGRGDDGRRRSVIEVPESEVRSGAPTDAELYGEDPEAEEAAIEAAKAEMAANDAEDDDEEEVTGGGEEDLEAPEDEDEGRKDYEPAYNLEDVNQIDEERMIAEGATAEDLIAADKAANPHPYSREEVREMARKPLAPPPPPVDPAPAPAAGGLVRRGRQATPPPASPQPTPPPPQAQPRGRGRPRREDAPAPAPKTEVRRAADKAENRRTASDDAPVQPQPKVTSKSAIPYDRSQRRQRNDVFELLDTLAPGWESVEKNAAVIEAFDDWALRQKLMAYENISAMADRKLHPEFVKAVKERMIPQIKVPK